MEVAMKMRALGLVVVLLVSGLETAPAGTEIGGQVTRIKIQLVT
jgi:hypothetical protein